MVVLYIICAVILILFLLLLLPVKLKVLIDRNFTYKVSVGAVTLITSKSKRKKKREISKENGKHEQENYLKKLFKEKGFSRTVVELFSYLKIIFSEIGYFLRKLKIRDFSCNITVSDADAAETAISYGLISTAVYGFTGFLNSVTDFKYKKISVNADYSGNNSLLQLGFTVKIKILYLVIIAFKLLIKFINYKREV